MATDAVESQRGGAAGPACRAGRMIDYLGAIGAAEISRHATIAMDAQ